MKNRASAAPIFASPAAPRRSDAPFSWGERLMLRLMGLPTIEEVEERTRNYRGFIASLTPEQIAAMDATDEFEVLGNPNGPKRKF
jgi:hypothetical protein